MHGFGSHTFSFINAAGERHGVKFTWKTQQGIENLTDEKSTRHRGRRPRKRAARPVPVHRGRRLPLREVGVLELNRNPENFFAEVEQAAFSPAQIVPGIGFSPDRMLQAQLFPYGDAQRYRLGVNHHQIPVNAPKCPFHSYHRDGAMRVDGNAGGTISYVPNSANEWEHSPEVAEPPLPLEGDVRHWEHREEDDHYAQPGAQYRLMSEGERQRLAANTARAMGDAPTDIQRRHVQNCSRADADYGARVAAALGLG